jgi:citrate synthase
VLTRTLASCGVPIQASMSGGLLSLGDVHGGAGEQLGEALAEAVAEAGDRSDDELADAVIDRFREAGERVPGFGHPHHPDFDPRTRALVALADERGLLGRHTAVALRVGERLRERLGRSLPLNVDGATAPLLLDLGFSWRMARPLIFTARSVGLAAHAVEELEQGGRWRHVPGDRITYTGPRGRKVAQT